MAAALSFSTSLTVPALDGRKALRKSCGIMIQLNLYRPATTRLTSWLVLGAIRWCMPAMASPPLSVQASWARLSSTKWWEGRALIHARKKKKKKTRSARAAHAARAGLCRRACLPLSLLAESDDFWETSRHACGGQNLTHGAPPRTQWDSRTHSHAAWKGLGWTYSSCFCQTVGTAQKLRAGGRRKGERTGLPQAFAAFSGQWHSGQARQTRTFSRMAVLQACRLTTACPCTGGGWTWRGFCHCPSTWC